MNHTPTEHGPRKPRPRPGGIAAVGLALGLLLTGALCAGGAETTLLTIEGKVEVAPKATGQWAPGRANQPLNFGDLLRTGPRSRATLQLSDLTVLRVNELTSMEIQPPPQPGGKPQLNQRSGSIYFFNRERPADVKFRTPNSSGAIRGTEFHLAVEENGRTVLTLLDGEVSLSNELGDLALATGDQGIVETGQAPRKTPVLDTINIIQWSLYYPAVIDPAELGLSNADKTAFAGSLAAYDAGDLPAALQAFPENRQVVTAADRTLLASLALAAGQVGQTEAQLQQLPADSSVSRALRLVIAAVKNQPLELNPPPATASELLAQSYYLQSRLQLEPARETARAAVTKAPQFGAAWIRLAELEFSFGRTRAAADALDRGLQLAPRHAAGLALRGFLFAAQNRPGEAASAFDQAIVLDGGLGDAWLGRGLMKIRAGDRAAGRRDLQVAATLEPQRAVLRSYLGKAFHQAHDPARAQKELALAQRLDPNDPTPWLYGALLNQQENRLNESLRDLERSKELNDNRSVYRSRLLLDQDRAVRGANLAAIYRDAGLLDTSVREASRAVNADYANASAHQFLAGSYDAYRDPKLINLRYEAPWFSERLTANLLAPVGAGSLSQNISQQEYTRLFDGNRIGVFSSTEYFSSGDWIQAGTVQGVMDNTSFALDAYYRSENGQRPNNDLEQLNLAARFKQQLTPQDSVLFEASYFEAESGDVAQYYNQANASSTFRAEEKQDPNLLLGYHHEWAPGSHTLFLAARFRDTLTLGDPNSRPLYLRTFDPGTGNTNINLGNANPFSFDYRSRLVAYSAELQQIWQQGDHTVVAGARYQTGESDTHSELERPIIPVDIDQRIETDLSRVSLYAYEHWQALESLRFTVGLSYDRLHFPKNIDTAPISADEDTEERWSPRAGVEWSPARDTHLRAAWTRSLGGVFFDNSVRLEPTQVAGFNQAFRSLIPESVIGLVPGTRFQTWGLGLDQALKRTGTYLVLEAELLESDADRTVGLFENSEIDAPAPDTAASTRQSLDYQEKSLVLSLGQLIGDQFAVGTRYRFTRADIERRSPDIDPADDPTGLLNGDEAALLHQVQLYALYHHRCGFFAQVDSIWSQQSNRDYATPIPGDEFWQHNIGIGYRWWQRRAEARVGLLNIFDQDYRLNPLTLHRELPRERTFAASVKINF